MRNKVSNLDISHLFPIRRLRFLELRVVFGCFIVGCEFLDCSVVFHEGVYIFFGEGGWEAFEVDAFVDESFLYACSRIGDGWEATD